MKRRCCGGWIRIQIVLIAVWLALPQGFAAADVADSAANGFTAIAQLRWHEAGCQVCGFGLFPAGHGYLASPVDTVLTEQIHRLKNYVESGSATAK